MNSKPNTDKHFKGQLDNEIVECFFRKHWIVLIGNIVIFFVFIGIIIFISFHFEGIYEFFSRESLFVEIMAVLTIGLFTAYIHKFFLGMIRYYLDIVVITNYRIVQIDKSLYLRDEKDAIDLPKIQDIQKSQYGIIKKILNFGELVITLSSTATTKTISLIPNPEYYFKKINQLKREYIKERTKE